MSNEICCSRFDPDPWDDKEITWENKKFVAARVRSFFHIPLNFGSVMKKNVSLIEATNAKPECMITLSDEASLWSTNVYLDITRDVPDVRTTSISGTFLSRVFEGPYRNIGAWAREMKAHVGSKGKEIRKLCFYYTTCPKCAKKYNKNYVVLLARI